MPDHKLHRSCGWLGWWPTVTTACGAGAWNGLRSGSPLVTVLCRSGVHTKLSINMGDRGVGHLAKSRYFKFVSKFQISVKFHSNFIFLGPFVFQISWQIS